MRLVGIDPSFKGFGISIIDTGNKTIKSVKLSADLEKLDFKSVNEASEKLVSECLSIIGDCDVVITETPPPRAMFSAGLYALDSLLVTELKRRGIVVYGVTCQYLGHIHGKRKWNKSESVRLAKEICKELQSSYIINQKWESNQCEAFLIGCRAFVFSGLGLDILKINGKFADKLEFDFC